MAFLAAGARVRGSGRFVGAGYKALEIAANHALDDEDEQTETVAEEVAAGGLCIDGEFDNRVCGFEDQSPIGNAGPQEPDGLSGQGK